MSHTHASNLVHCVFSTKDRANLIHHPDALCRYITGIAKAKNITLLAAGGTANHLHLLISLPPAMPLAQAMRDLKGNSSRMLSEMGRRFSLTSSDNVVRVTPRAAAACVMVKPRGSIHWRSTKPPGCGGFFIGMIQDTSGELSYCPGSRKSMPRASLALVVAGTFSSAMGILRARCSLNTHRVLPTMA